MTSLEEKVRDLYAGQIKNLVFEGGGVWGIAYEGALAELERLGILAGVERVAGASAGAITACLLAIGHTAEDVGRILRTTDFNDFTDDSFGFARDTARLLTEYGWYKGDAFHKWIRRRIAAQTRKVSHELRIAPPPARPTFRELASWQKRAARKGRALPDLHCVGTNLSQQRRETYSNEKTPTFKIDDAVRSSMSIPLFFACYRGARRGKERDVIVDGGLTWNYPVNLFDDVGFLAAPANGHAISYARSEKHVFNAETLGFRLDTTAEIEWNLKDWQSQPVDIDNIVQYGWALVGFVRAIANKLHLHKNDWTRTVFIDVGAEIGFTDFDLSGEQKDLLSARGRDGVQSFFQWAVTKKGQREIARIYAKMA